MRTRMHWMNNAARSMAGKSARKPARSMTGARTELLEARRLLSEYYVAPNGNDANPGTPAAPWKTLQHAADHVEAGDSVTVHTGRYAGFQLTTSGTAERRIRFVAERDTIIDERNAHTPDGINLEGASYITIQGFFVTKMARAGIRSVANAGVEIVANECDRNVQWGILTGFSQDVLIEENVASRSVEQHGIYVGNSADNPIVRGNTCFGNKQCGIQLNSDAEAGGDGVITGAIVENNTIYSNGRGGGSAINLDGVQRSTIRNNVLYDNHSSGISLYRHDGTAGAKDNVVFNNTVVMADDEASPGRYALNIKRGSTGNVVRNNILFSYFSKDGESGSIAIADDSLGGFSSDYNIVSDAHTLQRRGRQMTLGDWRADTGNDAHSRQVSSADELFNDARRADFHLRAGSAAIDAGVAIKNVKRDSDAATRPSGHAADIGAFEFQQYAAPRDVRATTSQSEIALTWRDPADGAAKFAIYRRGENERYVKVATVSAGRTEWRDVSGISGLRSGMTYAYKIVAYSDAGWGDASDPITAMLQSMR